MWWEYWRWRVLGYVTLRNFKASLPPPVPTGGQMMAMISTTRSPTTAVAKAVLDKWISHPQNIWRFGQLVPRLLGRLKQVTIEMCTIPVYRGPVSLGPYTCAATIWSNCIIRLELRGLRRDLQASTFGFTFVERVHKHHDQCEQCNAMYCIYNVKYCRQDGSDINRFPVPTRVLIHLVVRTTNPFRLQGSTE